MWIGAGALNEGLFVSLNLYLSGVDWGKGWGARIMVGLMVDSGTLTEISRQPSDAVGCLPRGTMMFSADTAALWVGCLSHAEGPVAVRLGVPRGRREPCRG